MIQKLLRWLYIMMLHVVQIPVRQRATQYAIIVTRIATALHCWVGKGNRRNDSPFWPHIAPVGERCTSYGVVWFAIFTTKTTEGVAKFKRLQVPVSQVLHHVRAEIYSSAPNAK